MFYRQLTAAIRAHRGISISQVVAVRGIAVAGTESGQGHFLYSVPPTAGLPPICPWPYSFEGTVWFLFPPTLPLVKHKLVDGWFEVTHLDHQRTDMWGARGNFGGIVGSLITLDAYVTRHPEKLDFTSSRADGGQEL